MLSIKQLSQETGIGIDTLRVWERRYNFPRPQRDRRGRRQYPMDQVNELRIVRQLQLEGHRPGTLFKLDAAQRLELLTKEHQHKQLEHFSFDWILKAGPEEILIWMQQQLDTMGINTFIRECVIPVLRFMDLNWKTGSMGIAREHIISDQLSVVLHQFLDLHNKAIATSGAALHCLCLTLNHERHKLGVLMAACVVAHLDIPCTWLQEDIPISEVNTAVEAIQANMVMLSFSTHFPAREAMEQLAALRRMLPQDIHIIAGGGAMNKTGNIPGVHICTRFDRLPAVVKNLEPVLSAQV